ncbi:23 kDa integral membrane protein-like [Macrobrachium nipponense]|uniref:23 kDa integral membrane protein-like n=1 Tax=Macrobrachium nipponense TaxID=159736 RepID=UPI0030C80D39
MAQVSYYVESSCLTQGTVVNLHLQIQVFQDGFFTKISLFFVNFIVLVLGLAIVITAAIFMSNGNDFGFMFAGDTFSLPIFSMSIGIAMLVLCFIGCCGAIKENMLIVKVYGGLLCVLVIAQLVVGILIMVNASVPVEHIQTEMDDTFSQYGVDHPEIKENIDSFQSEAGCCGVRDYNDWAL